MADVREVGAFDAVVFFPQAADIHERTEAWFSACHKYLEGPVLDGLGNVVRYSNDTGVKFIGELRLNEFTYEAGRSLQYSLVVPYDDRPGEWRAAVLMSLWVSDVTPHAWLVCDAYSERLSNYEVAVLLRDLVAEHVNRNAVVYGAVAFGTTLGSPILEGALRRSWIDGLHQAESVLRGYSWITVVPAALAAVVETRAAKFPQLKARRTGAGDLIVQAGETPQDYDEATQSALFECLAPVLASGTPRKSLEKARPRGIIYRDAREIAPFHLPVEPA